MWSTLVLAAIVILGGTYLLLEGNVSLPSGADGSDAVEGSRLTVVTDSQELMDYTSLEETRDDLVSAGLLHRALRHIITQQQSGFINECGGADAVREALLLAVPSGYGSPKLGLSYPNDLHPFKWSDDTGGDKVSGHITVDCAVVRTR